MSLGGGRSTDAATVGDVGPPSMITDPYRRRRAGLWGAVEGSPGSVDLGGSLGAALLEATVGVA